MLTLPQQGLVTGQGFRPVAAISPLCDADLESKRAFEKLGKYLDMFEIAYNDILVMKYIPEKIGNLLTGAPTQLEQRWQNKCGLVLKYGPKAKNDGFVYEAGDWVYYRPSDGQEIGLKCERDAMIAHCLILSPAHVIGRVTNPDIIW